MTENNLNKEGLTALEFIANLDNPPSGWSWSMIAERANKNMYWLLETDDYNDNDTWLEDEIKKLLTNASENTKVLKAWLLPRLKHEEVTRDCTYPTSIVLQIIGFLDRNLLMEIIDERLSFIGDTSIDSNDETYYHKLEIMIKTFDPIIATLFRRADACRIRKEGSNSENLTGSHAFFSNEPEEEFKTIWQIISKNALFKYFASTTNTVTAIGDGSIQGKTGIYGSGFIKFLDNLPPENNKDIENLRTSIISANHKVIKEQEERYGYY